MAQQVCLYFQVHQPLRLKHYTFFDIGHDHHYEDDAMNKEILFKVAEKCYLPANEMLYDQIIKHKGQLHVNYSLSGVFIEQLENLHPKVIRSFQRLVDTGCVEILGETYYHSLAFTYSEDEFLAQTLKHEKKIFDVFGVKPTVFRNTELIYNNDLAKLAGRMGYKGILTEGTDEHLAGRHPNQCFKIPDTTKVQVLLRNYSLSDDIAFRFEENQGLNGDNYSDKILAQEGNCVNLFMDYETIGEHHWDTTGIFDFWRDFTDKFIAKGGSFVKCSSLITDRKIKESYDIHKSFISWADTERDLSAWKLNSMQIEALDKIYGLEKYLIECDDKKLWHTYRKLQTSDHFYYMSTKGSDDGNVHAYFSPYNSPYDAYIYYMNALADLEVNLERKGLEVINW